MDQRLDSWELSLDAPVRHDSEDDHQSFIPDETPSAEDMLAGDQLRQLFHQKLMDFREDLNDKEKDIMDKRLLAEDPMTLSDLGALHGVSRERIRQVQARLMDKLKDYMADEIAGFEGAVYPPAGRGLGHAQGPKAVCADRVLLRILRGRAVEL